MKLVLTKKDSFTAKKDGQDWVKVFGITPDGKTVDFLIPKVKYEKFGLDDSKVYFNEEDLTSLFKQFPTVDVVFNQFGRVEELKG